MRSDWRVSPEILYADFKPCDLLWIWFLSFVEITSFRLERIFQPMIGLEFITGHMTPLVYNLAFTFNLTDDSHLEQIRCFSLFEPKCYRLCAFSSCKHVLFYDMPPTIFFFPLSQLLDDFLLITLVMICNCLLPGM